MSLTEPGGREKMRRLLMGGKDNLGCVSGCILYVLWRTY